MAKTLRIAEPPLERFKALYAALERDRRWWRDSRRLRYAAMSAIACKGEATEVAQGIRAMGKALEEECPWHWGISSHVQFIVGTLLLQNGDSAKRFIKELVRVRKLFRREKLQRGLQFELLAVLILRIQAGGKAISQTTVRRFKTLYEEMKRHHRFLTGPDDFPACAILTGQPGRPRKILEDIESIYQELRKHKFARGNWMQTAANIMYLADGTARAVAGRAGALKAEFRKRKVRIHESDYSEVAMLSLLDLPSRVVVARVMQIREALDEVRPKIDRETKFDLAVAITYLYLAPPRVQSTSLNAKTMVDVQSIVAAQQAALIACAGAATVMVATSSS